MNEMLRKRFTTAMKMFDADLLTNHLQPKLAHEQCVKFPSHMQGVVRQHTGREPDVTGVLQNQVLAQIGCVRRRTLDVGRWTSDVGC